MQFRGGWHQKLRFGDTPTVAAAAWLAESSSDPKRPYPAIKPSEHDNWSGNWLHGSDEWQDTDQPPCPRALSKQLAEKTKHQGSPPIYYAILMTDGDRMGEMFRKAGGIQGRRELSEKLADFARSVGGVVQSDHVHGRVVYAGGDDMLALLPTRSAVECALRLAMLFEKQIGGTISGGVAVVHYKEDLRFALGEARSAEKAAKKAGRNRLALRICRHGGEHSTVTLPWTLCQTFLELVGHFVGKNAVSDRWTYKLRAETETLRGLSADAIKAETKRLLSRIENSSQAFENAVLDLLSGCRADHIPGETRTDGDVLMQFVTLCQSASFLARGRDR